MPGLRSARSALSLGSLQECAPRPPIPLPPHPPPPSSSGSSLWKRRAHLVGLLDGDVGCALVLLLSALELQLAPPIPREDLTTALPSSRDRSTTLAGSFPDPLSESSLCPPCIPIRSSPTVSSMASLAAARRPKALGWETEAGWPALGRCQGPDCGHCPCPRARGSLSYLLRLRLESAVLVAKVVASEWLWHWVTCRARTL